MHRRAEDEDPASAALTRSCHCEENPAWYTRSGLATSGNDCRPVNGCPGNDCHGSGFLWQRLPSNVFAVADNCRPQIGTSRIRAPYSKLHEKADNCHSHRSRFSFGSDCPRTCCGGRQLPTANSKQNVTKTKTGTRTLCPQTRAMVKQIKTQGKLNPCTYMES